MFKRILSGLLMAIIMISTCIFSGCGSFEYVVVLTCAEEERIDFLSEKLREKFPEYEVIFQYVGTGELYSKLSEEKQSITGDIVHDFEITNMEMLLAESPEIFYDLASYDFSIYVENAMAHTERHTKYAVMAKQANAIIVNKDVLARAGAPIPKTYNDLLNPVYKDLICMPNPNQSGTGYGFYSGMVAHLGEEEALKYFAEFDKNVVEYTSSGSAPMKRVNSGEVGIGVCMLWQAVRYVNDNPSLEVIIPDNALPYTLCAMAMLSEREDRPEVKAVFDYMYTELNRLAVEAFNAEKLFVNQGPCTVANYPDSFKEFNMSFRYDYVYKQELLDKWGRS